MECAVPRRGSYGTNRQWAAVELCEEFGDYEYQGSCCAYLSENLEKAKEECSGLGAEFEAYLIEIEND